MTLLAPYGVIAVGVYLAAAAATGTVLWRRSQRLGKLSLRPAWPVAAAVALAAGLALVSISALQPAIPTVAAHSERTDAEAWLLIDTSGSMTASDGYHQPTRLRQAKRFALQLQHQLGDIPIGIAVMTNRALPLLPPTVDRSIYSVVVNNTVQENTPPPFGVYFGQNATGFENLSTLADLNFYNDTKKKLAIVVSDMETEAFPPAWIANRLKAGHVQMLLVRAGHKGQKIYLTKNKTDPFYHPQDHHTAEVNEFAKLFGNPVFTTSQVSQVAAAARKDLGSGQTALSGDQHELVSLSPYLLLAALPLIVFALISLVAGDITKLVADRELLRPDLSSRKHTS